MQVLLRNNSDDGDDGDDDNDNGDCNDDGLPYDAGRRRREANDALR